MLAQDWTGAWAGGQGAQHLGGSSLSLVRSTVVSEGSKTQQMADVGGGEGTEGTVDGAAGEERVQGGGKGRGIDQDPRSALFFFTEDLLPLLPVSEPTLSQSLEPSD